MKIDPEQVTAASLEKYENLMKGQVACARSNSNYQSGFSANSQKSLYSIHTWRNDARSHNNEVGAFELQFEKPTSLVSLNIDITFDCIDSAKLLSSLKQVAKVESKVDEKAQVQQTQIISTSAPETENNTNSISLGNFSIKGFQEDLQKALKETNSLGLEYRREKFMPLIVERNK